jgi:hypothetical protein
LKANITCTLAKLDKNSLKVQIQISLFLRNHCL